MWTKWPVARKRGRDEYRQMATLEDGPNAWLEDSIRFWSVLGLKRRDLVKREKLGGKKFYFVCGQNQSFGTLSHHLSTSL